MKHMKIVLASLVLTISVIGFSSFAAKYYNARAFALACFEYDGVTDPAFAGAWTSTTAVTPPTRPAVCPLQPTFLCVACVDESLIDPSTGKPNSTTRSTIKANQNAADGTQIAPGVYIFKRNTQEPPEQ